MKLCIYGAGAIGGYLGLKVHRGGIDVSLVAGGAHLEAMRRDGLALETGGDRSVAKVRCTDDPATLGTQDFLVTCLKAHSVSGAVTRCGR